MQFIERLLSVIAPHYCTECGQEGKLICSVCVSILTERALGGCGLCGAQGARGRLCAVCAAKSPLDHLWTLGAYEGTLERLVHRLKFAGAREAAAVAAEAWDSLLPSLLPQTVIVPLPTAPTRIRQRGYDQASLLAKHFARRRGYVYAPLLGREHNRRQVGANRSVRYAQAAQAYGLTSVKVARSSPILLVDDVVTTGASLQASADILRAQGFTCISAVVIARAQ